MIYGRLPHWDALLQCIDVGTTGVLGAHLSRGHVYNVIVCAPHLYNVQVLD